ncbi:MAG: hypothetical protein PW792_06910 [Acidobacteriaceae bacterium]|nr:hypothetical protein [Acidobacteriaceae bacterium]
MRRTFVWLTAAAVAMAALLAFLPAAGHDQLWLLYVAEHMRQGETLYGPTLFESNPPLIVWISLLPAMVAHLLHLESATVGKALLLLLEAAVAMLGMRLLTRLSPTQKAMLAFAAVVVYNVLPARDIGQRDHILALLVLPYLLLVSRELRGERTPLSMGVPVALLAMVGFALKPQEAVVAVVLEAALLLRRRSLRSLLRPAPICFLLGAALYFELIRTLAPLYLSSILPLLRETYWAFGHRTVPQLAFDAIELHILLAITAVFYFVRKPASTLPETLLLAGAAATGAYYLQGTGWYYQQLPGLAFTSFALVALVLPEMDAIDVRTPRWVATAAAALSVLAVALTTHFMGYPFTRDRSFPIDQPDASFFAGLKPGDAVATLTTTVDDTVMPAAKFHLTIAQRYPHLWMLPAILRNESGTAPAAHKMTPEQLTKMEDAQHRFFREDIQRWQPKLILVNRCYDPAVHCQVLEDRHDDLLAWFARDSATRALLAHYYPVDSRGNYDAFERR